jgi:hypothetical protein
MMEYLPFVAALGITLTVRILVELAIANQLLPKDPDHDRVSKYVVIANAIVHPIFFGVVAYSLTHGLWDLLIATPLFELVSAALKAILFARVGEKRDPLVAIMTACIVSVISLFAAALATYVLLMLLAAHGVGR